MPFFPIIRIGNDADLGALAEHVRGAAVGLDHIVFISGEVGIGGGILYEGRAMRGSGGFGGEIGHMLINPRGRHCRCGRRGCWETEIGKEAVLDSLGAPSGMTLGEAMEAHALGEAWTCKGMLRVGRALGAGVVNLLNIFNPQAIIFGGVTEGIFRATEGMVREALAVALPAPRGQVALLVPKLGGDSVALGAAELAFSPLLEDPLGVLAQRELAER